MTKDCVVLYSSVNNHRRCSFILFVWMDCDCCVTGYSVVYVIYWRQWMFIIIIIIIVSVFINRRTVTESSTELCTELLHYVGVKVANSLILSFSVYCVIDVHLLVASRGVFSITATCYCNLIVCVHYFKIAVVLDCFVSWQTLAPSFPARLCSRFLNVKSRLWHSHFFICTDWLRE